MVPNSTDMTVALWQPFYEVDFTEWLLKEKSINMYI